MTTVSTGLLSGRRQKNYSVVDNRVAPGGTGPRRTMRVFDSEASPGDVIFAIDQVTSEVPATQAEVTRTLCLRNTWNEKHGPSMIDHAEFGISATCTSVILCPGELVYCATRKMNIDPVLEDGIAGIVSILAIPLTVPFFFPAIGPGAIAGIAIYLHKRRKTTAQCHALEDVAPGQ